MSAGIAAACRSCGEPKLDPILSLGQMPLANALRTEEELDQPERRYPLDLLFCSRCSLVQIGAAISREVLFNDYLYFSSFSTSLLEHSRMLAEELIRKRNLDSQSLVVEIASNDGYLLQYFKEAGIPVLGIEPAANVAKVAHSEKNIPTVVEFFGEELAQKLRQQGKQADLIVANNVLAHAENINDFVKGLKILLKKDGVAVAEVPYVRDMVDACEFDTIYHEHVFYFSAGSLNALFKRHGLSLSALERIPIHGGSLRLHVSRDGTLPADGRVDALIKEEKQLGLHTAGYYADFQKKIEALRDQLRDTLTNLKKGGKKIAGYGAAAKGAILLNYCGLDKTFLDFVVDRSTYKQGRFMPGLSIPISHPIRLLEEMPDYTILLPWNFADEILAQQSDYRSRGGRFIIPIPEVRIV